MKNIILAIFLSLGLVFTSGMSGCKTNPETVAYKASKGSSITVEAALASWNDYVGQGKATLDQERVVKRAFEKYQTAQLAVLDAAIAYRTAKDAGATGTDTAQAKLNAAIAGASAALAGVIQLLTQFNVIQN